MITQLIMWYFCPEIAIDDIILFSSHERHDLVHLFHTIKSFKDALGLNINHKKWSSWA